LERARSIFPIKLVYIVVCYIVKKNVSQRQEQGQQQQQQQQQQ
jgi:hypothetical protein